MAIDPGLVLVSFPQGRMVHFWAKNSLFAHPVAASILYSLGVVPVDRTNHDNAKLFKGTIDTLKANGVVAIFPEGTSYTLPHMLELKSGCSWVCMSICMLFYHTDLCDP